MPATPRTELILVFHNHQPVGNFPEIFRAAHDGCYRPLLDELVAHPDIRVAMHHGGPLLEWLVRKEPGYLSDLRALVAREQVEIVGGGFYEPILSMLTDEDSRGQIEMMASFCRTHLNVTPAGLWLAERVWDPDLPRTLSLAGVQYTLLDASHFEAAGMAPAGGEETSGFYVTEKAGAPIAVFPINRALRYAIPFHTPEQVVDLVIGIGRRLAAVGRPPLLTYGDDGEKFGLWPDSASLTIEPRWLGRLFTLLEEQRELVATTTPQAVLARQTAVGRVYLPTASYEELDAWALPAEAGGRLLRVREAARAADPDTPLGQALPFLRGGVWAGFLSKYPEANRIHKKMVQVSAKLRDAYAARGGGALYGEEDNLDDQLATAQRALYAGQCSCAYWHGWFGGVYHPHLRRAVSRQLLHAEARLDDLLQGTEERARFERFDFDCDLIDEALLVNRQVNAYAAPASGGALFAFDDRQRHNALVDVVPRRRETYHHQPSADGTVPATTLSYDDGERLCFVDRFYPRDAIPSAVRDAQVGDLGTFAHSHYALVEIGARTDFDLGVEAVLRADGFVRSDAGEARLRIAKRYLLPRQGAAVQVVYTLTHEEGPPVDAFFSPELNIGVLPGAGTATCLRAGGRSVGTEETGGLDDCDEVSIVDSDRQFSVVISAEGCRGFWHYPIEVLARSDAGFEVMPQGIAVLPLYPLELRPGDVCDLAVVMGIEPISTKA